MYNCIKKKVELNIKEYIEANFDSLNYYELIIALGILRKKQIRQLKVQLKENEDVYQKQIDFLQDKQLFNALVDKVLQSKITKIEREDVYDALQSDRLHKNDVINFDVENLKNMPAKNLMATLEYFFQNYKKISDEKISPEFINNLFQSTGKILGLTPINTFTDKLMYEKDNINNDLEKEFETIKDIKEVQDFIALYSLDEDVKKHIPAKILLQKERSAVFKLLKWQSLNDAEKNLLLKTQDKKERLDIATLFNNKRNKVKEFFKKLIIENLIEKEGYLKDAEKNNELFKQMLFANLGDPYAKNKYEINVGGTNFKIQVSVGPIKTKSSIINKLNHKWESLETEELINDVLRCRIVIESPSNITNIDVNKVAERIGRIFTSNYDGIKYVSKIDLKGASTKDGANRPGAKSTGALQSVSAEHSTTFEIQVIPSVQAMNNLNLGLKNHDFYGWIKLLNTQLKTFIKDNGITEGEIKSFVNNFLNNVDVNYNEKYEDFRELALSNIYKDLIEDFGSPHNEYFNANYIIKNKDRNLNAIEQPRLYNQMLTGIKIKIQNAGMFKQIKNKIYAFSSTGNYNENSVKQYIDIAKKQEFLAMKFRRTIEVDNSYQQDFIDFLEKNLELTSDEMREIMKNHKSIVLESDIDSTIQGKNIILNENQIAVLREAKEQNVLPTEFVQLINKYFL